MTSVRYVIRIRRAKKTVTATIIRRERRLPFPRSTTVGVVEWTTGTKDQDALRMEARRRGMPHVRADQRRRGVLPPPLHLPLGTERPGRPPARTDL